MPQTIRIFGLTPDIATWLCPVELPISKAIHDWKHVLWNVHIEDMKAGVHDHLMFGEGEVDFRDTLNALQAIAFEGMISVELSRHSFDAVNVAWNGRWG
ncbi:MAG: TIM barrel protein [Gemmataceae bacterium]